MSGASETPSRYLSRYCQASAESLAESVRWSMPENARETHLHRGESTSLLPSSHPPSSRLYVVSMDSPESYT